MTNCSFLKVNNGPFGLCAWPFLNAHNGLFGLCASRRILFLFILAGAAAMAQQPPAQQAQPAQPAVTVPGGLNLNNASLLEVINLLAQDLHINYVLDSSIKGGTVTINTYGQVRDVDLKPLLETILRMNNLAMVQVGNVYRIIPAANIAHQPVSPITETDPSKIPEDERLVLNLVFLRYVTSAEMDKVLLPFMGDGAQLTNYDPANLLIILDNSRNMKRTLELISLFDSDTFAGQRVRAFETKNGRPSDIAKELEQIFNAYALSGEKGGSPVRFLPINRINTVLAVAPNPGVFNEVEKWFTKLDIPAKVTAGSIDNYVYKLKYGRAEVLGSVINQLYGGCGMTGLYGGMPGNSTYPANGYAGMNGGAGMTPQYGMGGGYGMSPGGYGGYGGGGYGAGGYGAGGYGTGGYGMGGYPSMGFGAPCIGQASSFAPTATAPATPLSATIPAGGSGMATAGAASPAQANGSAPDQTGTYLTQAAPYGRSTGPRIIPNPFDNTLLVQGTPDQWQQIQHLLEQLDVSPRQVLIDAKIYEIDLTGDLTWGVESYLQKAGTSNPNVPAHQLLGISGPISQAGGALGLGLSAGTLVGQSRQLLAFLQANETRTKAKVLSSPSVIATDSIPASITVGDSVPTISAYAPTALQNGGTTAFASSVQNTSTGIGLNILARVNPSGIVTMVINQNITAPIPNPLSSSGASGSNIDSPSFSQRNVSTQVTVQDGDTIAIGGIITDNTTESIAGIPFLDRIPYIGAIFGQKNTTTQRTELIVFLTPRVIYDTTQITDATEDLKQKVRGLQKLMQQE